ncbi:PLP-dependent aminotransferase family protein [Terribacillus sp. FSL K6-0262]|uniref:MocR-like transcriptional regulator GabR n=1 Tax=Terribacillus sp. FSL K6-0262 TaxID=2921447 RepID=UPI0030ED48B3
MSLYIMQLDRERNEAFLYQQIYQQMKQAILERRYLPHDKLPSKRELAANLRISLNSVNAAYQQLVAEGYLYTRERQGFFVEELDSFYVQPENHISDIPSDLLEADEKREVRKSFSHMSADINVFPLDKWLWCEQQALRKNKKLLEEYVDPQGLYSVRKTIAQFLSQSRGVRCYPEQIVLGSGTQLLTRQLTKLLPKETIYGLEEPGYQRMYHLLKSEGRVVSSLKIDRKGIRIDALEASGANVLLTTPSHQFPTGAIMPISRRIQLLNWANSAPDRYIVEDDYDSEYKYDADSIPSLQGMDGASRVIYMGSFSKSLLPGLRMSYMVLPIPLLEVYKKTLHFLMSSCSTITQLTLQAFIETGEYQKHIKKTTKLYRVRRAMLIEKLKAKFGDTISVKGEKSGLHFLVSFHVERTEEEIKRRAEERGYLLYGISRFYNQSEPPRIPTLILGFASMRTTEMDEAVELLYEAVFE